MSWLQLLVFLVTIEAANLLYAYATLFGDGSQGLTILNLVVELFTHVAVISSYSTTIHLLLGVATVAHLATSLVGIRRFESVCVAVEIIEVACNILVAEVEHQRWVEGYAAKASLEVEVRTSASTGVTTQSDYISCSYLIVLFYELCGEMAIDGLQTIVVAYHDIFTISTTFISYDTNLA